MRAVYIRSSRFDYFNMKFQILFKSLILLFAGSASCQSFFAKLAETWSQWTGLSASNNRAISDERMQFFPTYTDFDSGYYFLFEQINRLLWLLRLLQFNDLFKQFSSRTGKNSANLLSFHQAQHIKMSRNYRNLVIAFL